MPTRGLKEYQNCHDAGMVLLLNRIGETNMDKGTINFTKWFISRKYTLGTKNNNPIPTDAKNIIKIRMGKIRNDNSAV